MIWDSTPGPTNVVQIDEQGRLLYSPAIERLIVAARAALAHADAEHAFVGVRGPLGWHEELRVALEGVEHGRLG